ncbi:hypothetical protein [Streptomyces diastatochromogenes]
MTDATRRTLLTRLTPLPEVERLLPSWLRREQSEEQSEEASEEESP